MESSAFGVRVLRSKGGHKYGFKEHGEARRWQLNWNYFTAAERTALKEVWAATDGGRYPFYIDIGENTNPTLYLVRFAMSQLVFKKVADGTNKAYAVSIIIEEEI